MENIGINNNIIVDDKWNLLFVFKNINLLVLFIFLIFYIILILTFNENPICIFTYCLNVNLFIMMSVRKKKYIFIKKIVQSCST